MFACTSFLCSEDKNLAQCVPLNMTCICSQKKKRPAYMNIFCLLKVPTQRISATICFLRLISGIIMCLYTIFWMYQVAFFLDPNPDTLVQCLESCCSEACPPRFSSLRLTFELVLFPWLLILFKFIHLFRFPPIKSSDYIFGRINSTYK